MSPILWNSLQVKSNAIHTIGSFRRAVISLHYTILAAEKILTVYTCSHNKEHSPCSHKCLTNPTKRLPTSSWDAFRAKSSSSYLSLETFQQWSYLLAQVLENKSKQMHEGTIFFFKMQCFYLFEVFLATTLPALFFSTNFITLVDG